MVSSVSASGGAMHQAVSGGPQDMIEVLRKQIKVLNKKIVVLQKQLMETGDPKEQKRLIQEIEDTGRLILLMEQQIAQIESNERQKEKNREEAKEAMKKREQEKT